MPSMSYCMFENTSNEMDQIINTVAEVETFDELDLNRDEEVAFVQLIRQCVEFVEYARGIVYMDDAGGHNHPLAHHVKQALRDTEFMS